MASIEKEKELATKAEKEQVRIPVPEVAQQMGGPVELVFKLAERDDIPIESDWAERASIAQSDAARLVGSFKEAQRENDERRAEYERQQQAWERARLEVATAAYSGTIAKYRERDAAAVNSSADFVTTSGPVRMAPLPDTRERAREARDAALEEFDRKSPRPEWS